ncbi:MAG: O-methyltransferase [Candidatus Hydrogenedentes bacterium]|nr:O-methyltransferase [Candidatus Hydrogenedentota bacterium]
MRSQLRNAVNSLLKPLGIELRRIDSPRLFPRVYADTLNELLGAFHELGLSPLPADDRRLGLMMQLMGAKVSQSIYLMEYLRKSFDVAGDVCEFGVAAGATSALIANEMRATDKKLWLFDSFQGLPKPTAKDRLLDDILELGSMDRYEGAMSFDRTHVEGRLREIDFPESRTVIVPGFIEDTLGKEPVPSRISFSYVDLDLYEPIRLALEFLHGVTTPGGFIMVDDYGFLSEGAKIAVDEFLHAHASRYEKISSLPFAGPFAILHKRTM